MVVITACKMPMMIGTQLAQTELVAHSKGNKAQSSLADDTEDVHFLKGVEAKSGNVQPSKEERPEKQSGHQGNGTGLQQNAP